MANNRILISGMIILVTGIILMIISAINGGTGDNPVTKWQTLFWLGVGAGVVGFSMLIVGYFLAN